MGGRLEGEEKGVLRTTPRQMVKWAPWAPHGVMFVGAILDFAMLAMTPRWAARGTALGLAWKLKLSLYVFNDIHRIVTSCLGVCILNRQRVKNIERQIIFIHGHKEKLCHEVI